MLLYLYLLLPALVIAASSEFHTQLGKTLALVVPTENYHTTQTFVEDFTTIITPSTTIFSTLTVTEIVKETTTSKLTLARETWTSTFTTKTFTTFTATHSAVATRIGTKTVTSTSTGTISSSGFVPLASARTQGSRSQRLRTWQNSNAIGNNVAAMRKVMIYPSRVFCTTFDTITTTNYASHTAPTSTFISIAPATTVYLTLTEMTTLTLGLTPATVTATTTETSTMTTTTTNMIYASRFVTETQVVSAPTPINAMCLSDNMVQAADLIAGKYGWTSSNAIDAADCCNQCFVAGSGCSGYGFYFDPIAESHACVFNSPDDAKTCNPGRVVGSFETAGSFEWIVGNSFCGQIGERAS